MQDQPTARELVDAVAQFLNTEITPTLTDPRLRFRALVAANVLNVVARELEMGEAQLRAEYVRLAELLAGESPPPGSSFPSNVSSTPEAPLTPLMHQADALPDSIRVLAHPSSPEGRGQSDAEELRARVEALTRTLAARIRAGEADEGAFHDAAYKHVERTVIEKLEIANPRYLQKLGATRDGE